MTTSYNGWPASQNPDAIGINRAWEPIPGHRFPGGIKSGDVETVMTYLVRQLDARVEPIELYPAGDEWGYHYKQSANSPSLLSCHSSGTAIDYNATRHPNGKRGTWTAAQVGEIRKIQAEVGWVVHWLGDANGTPDEMHFEIKGSPTAVATAAAKIRTPAPQEDPMKLDDEDLAYIRAIVRQELGLEDDDTSLYVKLRVKMTAMRDSLATLIRAERDG